MPHILDPVGPAARQIADLGWFVLIAFSFTSLIMWGLLGWVAMRRTGSFAEHAPWYVGGGKPWIVVGGIVIPMTVLAVIFVMGLRVMSAFPLNGGGSHGGAAHAETMGAREPRPSIRILGHQWWWEIQYLNDDASQQVLTANEIHIPAGRPVDIELVSRDVIHSFWVPQLHGKVDLVPGLVNRVRIQSDRPGLFPGECSEFCGVQHAHMLLLVSADAMPDFEGWLAQQREPAHVPETRSAERGQQVFLTKQCVLCHTIRGTDAHGLVGPDLTHIGSRRAIGANAFWNNTANLAAWATHAQSLKPGVQMPDITAFTGEELLALVEYLQQLR
jgi:cytochrome c oxidase subunit 2